jgi:hypothetical protein
LEDLGVYELVRRRCKVDISCDAATDLAISAWSDFANAVERGGPISA